jgi:hypothetical protein
MLISLAVQSGCPENLCKAVNDEHMFLGTYFWPSSLIWLNESNDMWSVSLAVQQSIFHKALHFLFFWEIYERSIFFYSLLRNILVKDSRLSWLRQGWMWLSKTYAVDKTFRKPRKKVQLRNQIVLFSESIRSLNYCNFGRLIFLKIWSIFFARKIWSVLTVSGYC